MKESSISLLHQSPNSLLTNNQVKIQVLHFVCFIIKETIDALTRFYFKNDYQYFDPHVGETSCQIRAYMICLMSKFSRNDMKMIIEEIKKLKNYHQVAVCQLANFNYKLSTVCQRENKDLTRYQILEEFLFEKGLIFTISNEAKFLVQCYFLSRFKKIEDDGDTLMDYDKVSEEMNVSKKLTKKIIHHFQVNVSIASIRFIEHLLNDLPSHKSLSLILSDLKKLDDDDRVVLPCYVNMKILLSHMHIQRCPLLLIIDRLRSDGTKIDIIPILFVPYGDTKYLLFSKKTPDYYLKQPCVVIQGVVIYNEVAKVETRASYISRISNYNLSTIILSYMANHPQYSGNKLRETNDSLLTELISIKKELMLDQKAFLNMTKKERKQIRAQIDAMVNLEIELNKMKLIGSQIGCSEKDKRLFFIKHIFCDIVGRYFEDVEEKILFDCLKVNKIAINPLPLLNNIEVTNYQR